VFKSKLETETHATLESVV